MREMTIEWSLKQASESWGGFLELLYQEEIKSAQLCRCWGNQSKWILETTATIDRSDLTTAEYIKNAWQLVRGGTTHEFLVIVNNPDNCLLSTSCFDKVFCKTLIRVNHETIRAVFVSPKETINDISQAIDANSQQYRLVRLQEYTGTKGDLDILTDRQQEILKLAFKKGYYEIPQETTIDDLAGMLSLDKSTVWEHLNRAENKVISQALNGGTATRNRPMIEKIH